MATVSWNALEGMLVVKTRYVPAFVEELKFTVPSYDRKFNPADRTWLVGASWIGTLGDLLLKYYGSVEFGEHLPPGVQLALSEYVETHEAELSRRFEEAAMAATSKAEVIYAWGFPSRREGPSAVNYEVLLRKDGTLSCNCPGWVFNKLRTCAHTKLVCSLEVVAIGVLEVLWILRTPERHGGSRWMGDPDQAPKASGTAAPEADTRVGRRYVSHEG